MVLAGVANTRINRRRLLLGSAALAVASPKVAHATHAGVTVGAIRWDAFYVATDTAERPSVEAALGPAAWQSRSPACASITATNAVSFAGCGTQTQIDGEIAAAHAAKIDYWAYCWYGAANPMQQAWRLHQSSSLSAKVNWCLIFPGYSFFVTAMAGTIATYTGYLAQTNYQKVLVSRPLVYLLGDSTPRTTLASSIITFRVACASAGLGAPYIVLLVAAAAGVVAATGADAIGTYSVTTPDPAAGPYAALVTVAEAYWATLAATGQAMVPTAITGHDRRPRVERPVPWEMPRQRPYVGDSLYYAAGTPAAIAAHVGDMVSWIGAHPENCPAATGLIYSWDEHDEGGSTLNPSLGTGGTILTAVGEVL